MNILLVSPRFSFHRKQLLSLFYYHSLALEQVAAATPHSHTVEIVDEMIQDINFDNQYDLIGISCLTCNAYRAYEIADEFRRRHIPVVLGGYHPTILPEEAKQHADAVVIGEAESTWPQVLVDFQNKKLLPFYYPSSFVDPAAIPPAKRCEKKKTLGPVSIQIARGCPTQCAFCSMNRIEGSIYRPRPIKNVIEEMKIIKEKHLFFTDASLTTNPPHTKTLFREMRELNKRFDCYGNINILGRDEEFLTLAADAGCRRWLIGFESISQEAIDSVRKKTNKVKDYATSIKKIKDHGMMASGLFMFGFDTDHLNVFKNTLQALQDWDIDTSAFSIVTPYPGTQLFTKYHNEGRITSYDWSQYTEGNVNFIPKHMSPYQLLDGVRHLGAEFYSFSNSYRRCVNSTNLNVGTLLNKFMLNFYFTQSFNKELYNL